MDCGCVVSDVDCGCVVSDVDCECIVSDMDCLLQGMCCSSSSCMTPKRQAFRTADMHTCQSQTRSVSDLDNFCNLI